MVESPNWIETDIPARLDRLAWCRWHWLIVIGLGITWLLDGLEVTLAGSLAGMLRSPQSLGLSEAQVGVSATAYLAGAVIGALIFGHATDRLGRRKLFFLTLLLYLTATGLTAFSWNFASFITFRALTGAGIGGEYAAINSAIDELIPARVRGQVDLIINGTFWIGAAVGSLASIVFLNTRWFGPDIGWRLAFGIGAALGIAILLVRRHIPESPRWLLTHGRPQEAEKVLAEVEAAVAKSGCSLPPAAGRVHLVAREYTPWHEIWQAMVHDHRSRSVLGLILMAAQAFFYNAIFFTYGLVLMRYYGTSPERIGIYLLPFALGNFFGPVVLGKLFDSFGRKPMIAITYAGSGILLLITGWMFEHGMLSAATQTVAWSVIFFIASAAASSAYLTVSEIFPLEIRALAIAVFFAAGTLVGGVAAPALFSRLIASGSRAILFRGYAAAALLMMIAASAELMIGVAAERQPLESISAP
ncbi:MAG TPA: MFS transporter, partial [Bryobacteraceae bacterium]|nr:MFS transporter [Bryobacteraceae bacterium]